MNKKRLLSIIMTVMLIVALLPLSTFAEGDVTNEAAPTESVKEEAAETSDPSEDVKEESPKAVVPAEDTKKDVPAAGDTVEKTKEETSKDSVAAKGTEKGSSEKADKPSAEGEKKETEPAAASKAGNENSPAFSQSGTANGVTVSVAADAGVFPEGATLSVTGVPAQATAGAIAPKRENDTRVAASYTFDIKVLGKDGKELQPEEGRTVQVSFRAAEVADPNLDVSVYHISGGTADELAVQETGSTATARTNGFSYYTVEFTYGNLQYVLDGGGSVPLTDILQTVGLSGVPTDVQVSDSSLFSASNTSGAWVITSHRAFSTTEWMRVTIAGKVYDITVTDAQEETIIGGVKYSCDTENKTAVVVGYDNTLPYNLTIPAAISYGTDQFNVTDVAEKAFASCRERISVSFLGNVGSIGASAFAGCSELEGVSFGGTVGDIGENAFASCIGLRSVTFHGNVGSIGAGAFSECSQLRGVSFGGTVGDIGEYAFHQCKELRSVGFPSNVGSIGDYAFYLCSKLEGVSFGGTVGDIGENAFHQCKELTRVTFPTKVGSIGAGAFSECSKLEGVSFRGIVGDIGEYAFHQCKEIRSVGFPSNVGSIGAHAFYECSKLEGVDFVGIVGDIGEYAFSNCTALKDVNLGVTVGDIGENAFASCTELRSVRFPTNMGRIGDSAFNECSKLGGVSFGGTVDYIGASAFHQCKELTRVTFPTKVGSIGAGAFSECSKLEGVSFRGIVGDIGEYAFSNCTALKDVNFSALVGSIGAGAFAGCNELEDIYFKDHWDDWRNIDLADKWAENDGLKVHFGYDVAAEPYEGGTVEGKAVIIYGADGMPDPVKPVTATVKAVPNDGYQFIRWTSNYEVNFADENDSETTLETYVPKAKATANFELAPYEVTVKGGTTEDSPAVKGATVSIKANDPAPGTFFKCWESEDIGNDAFDDVTALETTFTMPGKPVTVTAVCGKILIGPAGGATGDPIPDQVYTGNAIEPELKVELEGVDEALIEGTDYDVEYKNNVDAGTATATVKLKGKWAGSGSTTFKITPANISTATVTAADQTYDGTEKKPDLTVTWNGKILAEGTDYDVTAYADNKNAGKVTFTVTSKGNYTGTANGTFKIAPADIKTATVTVADLTYDGTEKKPVPTVTWNGKTLTEGTDYDVTAYADNKDAGDATVTVKGKGNFTGTVNGTFKIAPADIKTATITAADQTYDGTEKKPVPTVTWNGKTLTEGTDYDVTAYAGNKDAGDATVTVTGKGNFTGTTNGTFKIAPADIKTATITAADQTYDGTEKKPVPTVTWNGKTLTEGTDYDVTAYADNKDAGDATVTVKGKGNFTGTANGTFTIARAKATITVDNASKVEGESDPVFTGTVEGLIVDGDLGEITYSREGSDEAPGTYKGVLTANYTDNPNYDVTVTNGDFTITQKSADTPTYKAVSGSGGTYTKGSGKTLTFTYKRSADDGTTFSHFKGITVDGKAVPEKDSSGKANWTAKSGSVIIELQSSYLETLSVGEHKLAAQFDDGADATATFTVKAKPATPTVTPTKTPTKAATTSGKATTTAPKTGDESNMLLWFLLICASLFVMFRIIPLRNRRYYDR